MKFWKKHSNIRGFIWFSLANYAVTMVSSIIRYIGWKFRLVKWKVAGNEKILNQSCDVGFICQLFKVSLSGHLKTMIN